MLRWKLRVCTNTSHRRCNLYKKKSVYNVIDNGGIPFIMSDKF